MSTCEYGLRMSFDFITTNTFCNFEVTTACNICTRPCKSLSMEIDIYVAFRMFYLWRWFTAKFIVNTESESNKESTDSFITANASYCSSSFLYDFVFYDFRILSLWSLKLKSEENANAWKVCLPRKATSYENSKKTIVEMQRNKILFTIIKLGLG